MTSLGLSARPGLRTRTQTAPAARADRGRAAAYGTRIIVALLASLALSPVLGFERSLTLVNIIGYAAAIAGLRQPRLGVFGIAIICAVDSLTRSLLLSGGLLRFNTFNYWLLVVIVLNASRLVSLSALPLRLLQALLALLALELAVSADTTEGIQHLLGAVSGFGLVVYFSKAAVFDDVWYPLALVTGTLSGAGVLMFLLQSAYLRPVNPNAWSYFPLTGLFAICLAFPFVLRQGQPLLLLMLLVPLNVLWVFLSGSRGALSIAAICLLYLVAHLPGISRRMTFCVGSLLLALVVSTAFTDLQRSSISRIEKLFDPGRSMTGRTSGRSDLALGGWYIFLENPLGVGTGGFGKAWANLGRREGLSEFRRGVEFQAHSAWVKVLVENGVPGAVLLAAFILSFTAAGLTSPIRGAASLGLLVTITISTALLSTEFQSKGVWFLAAGATVVLSLRPRVTGQHPHPATRRHPALAYP